MEFVLFLDCKLVGCGIDCLFVDVDGAFSTLGMAETLLVEVDMTKDNGSTDNETSISKTNDFSFAI